MLLLLSDEAIVGLYCGRMKVSLELSCGEEANCNEYEVDVLFGIQWALGKAFIAQQGFRSWYGVRISQRKRYHPDASQLICDVDSTKERSSRGGEK